MLAVAVLALSAGAADLRFSAVPVWAEGRTTERNLTLGFRVAFDGAKAATLRYSASSIARVWLNGEFLCYGPARGPHGIDRVDVIPLEGRVKDGRNVLAFEVAGYNVNSYYLINEPAYIVAEVLDKSGKALAATRPGGPFEGFVLDERVQKVPRFSFQRPFCEVYSLTPDFAAWRTGAARKAVPLAAVAGSRWTDRVAPYPDCTVARVFRPLRRGGLRMGDPVRPGPGLSLTGEDNPKRSYARSEIVVQPMLEVRRLRETDRRAQPEASEYALGARQYVLFDHAICDTGFIGATVRCAKPGRVYFHFDEVLVKDDIDVSRTGWQCINTVTYDFTAPGEYRVEAFEPNTLRYLKVMSDGFEGTVSDVFLRRYRNAMTGRAAFRSSDPKLNSVFEAARESFAQNAVDVLMDCPSRERAGWLGDSFFTSRTERWIVGTNPVERCFLENFARTEFYPPKGDRFVPMCYPADPGRLAVWVLPNWSFWFILEIGEYFRHTGDRTLVEALRPKVEGAVASLRKYRNADGLLEKLPGWVFVEWSFANNLVQDVSYPSNMAWAKALETAARLYGWSDCADEAVRVREAVRKQAWTGEWFCDNAVRQKDGSLKLSGECTETCQYYAFFTGLADAKSHADLWARLVRDFGPKRMERGLHPEIHKANAFVGNYLRLELLAREGLVAQAVGEMRDYFAGMAEKTGTLWEHDTTKDSCVHGFASHAAVFLLRDVLGVKRVDPVSREVVLDVRKDLPLDFCEGVVPVGDREEIRVSWKKVTDGVAIESRVPVGWIVRQADESAKALSRSKRSK